MHRATIGPVDSRSRRATWGLAVGITGWNVLQNNVPRSVYGWLNLAGSTAILLGSKPVLGLHPDDLGLGPGAVRRGLRVGAPLATSVIAGVASVASLPGGRRWFRDERVERHGAGELAKEALFRIPVGTGLFEELLFRGLVQGWARRRLGETRATIVSSAAFGLWHVLPTLRTLAVYRSGRLRATKVRGALSLTVAVVGTAAAGAGLVVLARRGRSVVAPAVVHAAVNSAAYVAAWQAAPEA